MLNCLNELLKHNPDKKGCKYNSPSKGCSRFLSSMYHIHIKTMSVLFFIHSPHHCHPSIQIIFVHMCFFIHPSHAQSTPSYVMHHLQYKSCGKALNPLPFWVNLHQNDLQNIDVAPYGVFLPRRLGAQTLKS